MLGRDVIKRAQRDAARGQVFLRRFDLMQPRQTHVNELRSSLGCDDDVRWFDVAMDDFAAAGVIECGAELVEVLERVGERERARVIDVIAEVLAFDKLKDDVVPAAIFADVVNAADVLVIEPRGRLSFVLKTAECVFVARLIRRKYFDRDGPIERRVVGAKYSPHSAAADKIHERIMAERLAG